MQQVLVIHGGDSFATYEEYLEFLKSIEVDLEYLNQKNWKSNLSDRLGEQYQVIQPRMPNKQNARYAEWKLWFEKYFALLDDGAILVGHSLGGCFLARYLSTEKISKTIKATLLVAAPYDEPREELSEFAVTEPLNKLIDQGGSIFLYHSSDDGVVPFSEVEKYSAALSNAHVRTFTDRGHFNQEEFPELVADIKNL